MLGTRRTDSRLQPRVPTGVYLKYFILLKKLYPVTNGRGTSIYFCHVCRLAWGDGTIFISVMRLFQMIPNQGQRLRKMMNAFYFLQEVEIDNSIDRAGQHYKKRNKIFGRVLCFVAAVVVVAVIIAIIVYATLVFNKSIIKHKDNSTSSSLNGTNVTMTSSSADHVHYLHK